MYLLEPIRIYATKKEIDEYHYRLGLIRITEIGESQATMEMVKNKYLTNPQDIIQRGSSFEPLYD